MLTLKKKAATVGAAEEATATKVAEQTRADKIAEEATAARATKGAVAMKVAAVSEAAPAEEGDATNGLRRTHTTTSLAHRLASRSGHISQPSKRRCSSCGKWKQLSEFSGRVACGPCDNNATMAAIIEANKPIGGNPAEDKSAAVTLAASWFHGRPNENPKKRLLS